MRTITKKVHAKAFTNNTSTKQSFRVIGSLDVDNKGTYHEIAAVDPFIFLDETTMRGDEAWPFPKHPHAGLVAMTYMLSGELAPWDNLQEKIPHNNRAGGFYYIDSAQGILHEEEPILSGGPLRWLQLWMFPGDVEDKAVRASTQMLAPEDVPIQITDNASIRVIVGKIDQQISPIKPRWPIQYLHIQIQPGHTLELTIQESTWQGFIYVLEGNGIFGSNQISAQAQDCLVLGNEDSQLISAINTSHSEPLVFVMATGKPHHRMCYKILCGGGALVAGNEEVVRQTKKRYEKNLEKFGAITVQNRESRPS